MTYLVDTDWVIHWLNGNFKVYERFRQAAEQGVAISVISVAELYEGVYYSRAPTDNEFHLKNFLRGVTLLDLDTETCQIFGRERGRLRQAGTLIADFDLLIGATALRHNLTLLSNNRRDFELIQGVRLESI